MLKNLFRKYVVRPLSYITPKALTRRLVVSETKEWSDDLNCLLRGAFDELTDDALHGMLVAMDFCLRWTPRLRKNIRGFSGRYVFCNAAGTIVEGIEFEGGDMRVSEKKIEGPDVTVSFKDAKALWRFMLSKDQDILDSLLKNEVETFGNLNYVYRFGFLAREVVGTLKKLFGIK